MNGTTELARAEIVRGVSPRVRAVGAVARVFARAHDHRRLSHLGIRGAGVGFSRHDAGHNFIRPLSSPSSSAAFSPSPSFSYTDAGRCGELTGSGSSVMKDGVWRGGRRRTDLFTTPRVARLALTLTIVPLFLGVFTRFKTMMQRVHPFPGTHRSSHLDRALLFGHDPWAVLQPVLGHPAGHSSDRFRLRPGPSRRPDFVCGVDGLDSGPSVCGSSFSSRSSSLGSRSVPCSPRCYRRQAPVTMDMSSAHRIRMPRCSITSRAWIGSPP